MYKLSQPAEFHLKSYLYLLFNQKPLVMKPSISITTVVLTLLCVAGLWHTYVPHAAAQTRAQSYRLFLSRADSLLQLKKLQEARVAYKQALLFNRESVEALAGLGRIAQARHDWENAQEWFYKALALQPNNQTVLDYLENPELKAEVVRADSFLAKHELKAADEIYRTVLKMNKNYIPALAGRGKVAYEKRNWQHVKEWFVKVLKIDPDNETARLYLTTNPSPEAMAHIKRGEEFRLVGEFKKAEKAYRKALKAYAGSSGAFRGLGRIAVARRKYDHIKEWFKKIAEIHPDDLESRYELGVAYRETGKSQNYIVKKIQFGKSKKYFEQVIAADSTYRDVFYQRALLERWKRNWSAAIAFAETQVRLKPDDHKSRVGVFKLYRLFLRNKRRAEVEAYLKSHPGEWTNLMLAELYRLLEDYRRADSYYTKLLNHPEMTNQTAVRLSLVRHFSQQKNLDAASYYFNQALANLETQMDAQLMFEDAKYIFTDLELQIFEGLKDASLKKEFFLKFWTERDPTPASTMNLRALEHYRRLVFAEKHYWFDQPRSWANNPDKMRYLKYPAVYHLNEELNDKGMIYVRHGPPDDYAVTPSASVSNESWHYYQRGDREEMIFHFLIDAEMGVGNNWRLAPVITDRRMLEDRSGWDAKLDRLRLASDGLDESSIVAQIADESKETVYEAMTSDYHTWDKDIKELPMPYYTASFRGDSSKTQFEVYFGLPIADLRIPSEDKQTLRNIEYSTGIFDSNWNELYTDMSEIVPSRDKAGTLDDMYVHRSTFGLEAGEYNLSLFSRVKGVPIIGGWKVEAAVPSFSSERLALSDIVLAFDIRPSSGTESIFARRSNLIVVPNPGKVYDLSKPVSLYYEIYNLQAVDGRTAFEIENKLTLLKKKRSGLSRLFGGDGKKKSLSILDTREGEEANPVEVATFDVSNLDPGQYRLTVRVKDLNAQQELEKSIELTLIRKP